jgi:hypothetical protein
LSFCHPTHPITIQSNKPSCQSSFSFSIIGRIPVSVLWTMHARTLLLTRLPATFEPLGIWYNGFRLLCSQRMSGWCIITLWPCIQLKASASLFLATTNSHFVTQPQGGSMPENIHVLYILYCKVALVEGTDSNMSFHVSSPSVDLNGSLSLSILLV